MKLLIVGGGGREHALAWKLAQSARVSRLIVSPGSAAIARHAECVPLESHAALADYAAREGVDLVLVGPEAPLVEGLADRLQARGVKVFGPSRAAAQLEGSKAFAKAFMQRHGIPSAAHRTFTRLADALGYVDTLRGRFVVKASGLAAGKGVTVCANRAAGRRALRQAMDERVFGDAGSEVVVESFLRGEEASYFVIADGEDFLVLPCCQDHKPVGDLDRGPNTGGMGAYAPTPLLTPEVEARVLEEVVRPTLRGMSAEGHPYRGVLYVGLMIDGGRPSVVEYNCRFGDPECEVQMLLLESDLLDVLEAAVSGGLSRIRPRWHGGAAACVVLAAPDYPGPVQRDLPIRGLDAVPDSDTRVVFHSGTALRTASPRGRQWVTRGGRVLTLAARGDDLRQALQRAYAGAERISWPGVILRHDIGLKGLLRQTGGRPALSVGIYGRPAHRAQADRIAKHLKRFGIGAVKALSKSKAAVSRATLAQHREAGVEAIVLLPGARLEPTGWAGDADLPIVAVGHAGAAGGRHGRSAGPVPVRAATAEDAAAHLARCLALKYPDVEARLKLAKLAARDK
jgi:phosphoribosylamine--glycine ligase